jgi:hypothetical protein
MGPSIDFRDFKPNQVGSLFPKDNLYYLSPLLIENTEKDDQVCFACFKPQLELERESSKPTCQLQSRRVNYNVEEKNSKCR